MKRARMLCAVFFAFAALCPLWQAAAGADAVWTREMVSQSSGTGGTTLRTGETLVNPAWQPTLQIGGYYQAEGTTDTLAYPQDSEMEALMLAWLEDNRVWDCVAEGRRSGNLYILSYDDHHGTIGTFDLLHRKQLCLSDIFADGFNYIDYINTYLALHMEEALSASASQYGETWRTLTVYTETGEQEASINEGRLQEAILKRSFGGYPRDYTRFALGEGVLMLYPAADDPYFSGNLPGTFPPHMTIPLTPDISPFGTRHFRFQYTRQEIGAHSAVLPQIEVSGDADIQPVLDKINNAVAGMYQEVVERTKEKDADLTAQGIVRPSHLRTLYQPDCVVMDEIVSVCFADGFYEGGFSVLYDTPVIRGQLFSLKTGDPLDLSGIWAGPAPADAWLTWSWERGREIALRILDEQGEETIAHLPMP